MRRPLRAARALLFRRLLAAGCSAVWSVGSAAADGSNADERTLVPSLSYDADAAAVRGGKSDGITYTGCCTCAYCGSCRPHLRGEAPPRSSTCETSTAVM